MEARGGERVRLKPNGTQAVVLARPFRPRPGAVLSRLLALAVGPGPREGPAHAALQERFAIPRLAPLQLARPECGEGLT